MRKASPKTTETAKPKRSTAAAKPKQSADKASSRKKSTATSAEVAAQPKRRSLAARAVSPPVSGPPPKRRAVFIDVENTSREEDLFDVIESLKLDQTVQPTDLTAVGNWRAVGQQTGRRLAALGAHLVHSAPPRGVRDWSDLWIAVIAGCWLGEAAPGDILEIVSNDRAFDAVGDAAAARGVVFRRLQHRRGVATAVESEAVRPAMRASRQRPRRRRGRRPPSQHATPPKVQGNAGSPPRSTAPVSRPPEIPHGATRDQMLELIARLTNNEPGRWVNLDVLERALKTEGFSRPPGSPRLVTRLRMLKDVEVGAEGRVRLTQPSA